MGAAIAMGVIGLGASIGGGMNAADSQKAANVANEKIAKKQRELQERIYNQSRGAPNKEGDISSILPFYGDEEVLGKGARDLYAASQGYLGTPQEQYARYGSLLAPFLPSYQRGNELINDISSGAMLSQRLSENEPVSMARRAVAQGQQQAILQAMITKTNQMKAARGLAGYTGNSTANDRALLGQTIGARQAAANALLGADLKNAEDVRGINDAQRTLAIQSLDLPFQRARQTLEADRLPMTGVNANFAAQLSPFEFFRINPSSYNPTPSPPVSAVPNLGQIVGAGVGQFASGLGNYYANQQLIRQMQGQQGYNVNPGYQGPAAGTFEPYNAYDPYDPSYWNGGV